MLQFLVRLGKSRFGMHFMPVVSLSIAPAYLIVELGLHDQMRNLFCAQSPSGRREKISDHLRRLIEETYASVKEKGFNVPEIESTLINFPPVQLKWFTSSTLEPITFGMTRMKSGLLIGLPSFYNYSKPDDVPDRAFEIRKLSLLRSSQGSGLEERELTQEEAHIVAQDNVTPKVVRTIDRNSEEGQDYLNTLLLSDDAKKFSIARELFLGDTYRPLFNTFVILISCYLAITASRSSVILLKLKDRHITQRLPAYAISGMLGYGNYRFLTYSGEQHCSKYADTQAKDLGEEYIAGAKEYYEKRELRSKILGIVE